MDLSQVELTLSFPTGFHAVRISCFPNLQPLSFTGPFHPSSDKCHLQAGHHHPKYSPHSSQQNSSNLSKAYQIFKFHIMPTSSGFITLCFQLFPYVPVNSTTCGDLHLPFFSMLMSVQ